MAIKLKTEYKDRLSRHTNDEYTVVGKVTSKAKYERVLVKCAACGKEKWSLMHYFENV